MVLQVGWISNGGYPVPVERKKASTTKSVIFWNAIWMINSSSNGYSSYLC